MPPESYPKVFLNSVSNSLIYSNLKAVFRGVSDPVEQKNVLSGGLFKHRSYSLG
jgi:hypothetical protein